MTNVGVYPILNEVADHIYDVGVGTQIGNGIGFTAGHVVFYAVLTGANGPTGLLAGQDGVLIPEGQEIILHGESAQSYSFNYNYNSTALLDDKAAVSYYNTWTNQYLNWKTAFLAWQANPGENSAPILSQYLKIKTAPPYPIFEDFSCGAIGSQILGYSGIDLKTANPDKLYIRLPQPTSREILSEHNLTSIDTAIYQSDHPIGASSQGIALFYNIADLKSLSTIMNSFKNASVNLSTIVNQTTDSPSNFNTKGLISDLSSGSFVFTPKSKINGDVSGTSGSPFYVSLGNSNYIIGDVSTAKYNTASLPSACSGSNGSSGGVTASGAYFNGVLINQSSFQKLNDAVNATQSSPGSSPQNLIVGVAPKSATALTDGYDYALGTNRRDLFVGTNGNELFYASKGDTVDLSAGSIVGGSGNNVVVFNPNDDANLTTQTIMTVVFGAKSGSTVVEAKVGQANNYVIDLSDNGAGNGDPGNGIGNGLSLGDVSIIAGGETFYEKEKNPGTRKSIIDSTYFEFLSITDKKTGKTLTWVGQNTAVGGFRTSKESGSLGTANAVNQLGDLTIILNGTKLSGSALWSRIQADYINNTESSTFNFDFADNHVVSSIDPNSEIQAGWNSKFFTPDNIQADGSRTLSTTTPSHPEFASNPIITQFSGTGSGDIVVTAQSGTGGAAAAATANGGLTDPTALYATGSGQILDSGGAYSTVYGHGGGDTFIFNQGYGAVNIDEADKTASPDNVLQLGVGLTAATTTISANDSGDVILTFATGDSVTLAGGLLSNNATRYGVQAVNFADGTVWTYANLLAELETPSANSPVLYGDLGANVLDGKGISQTLEGNGGGDTFVFKRGYGELAIEERDSSAHPANVLQLGAGLLPADVTVTADSSGTITLDFGNGDQVWLEDQLGSGDGVSYGVQQIWFANGTVWTPADIVARLDVVNANSTTLYGDNAGHTFDTKGVDDTVISQGGGDTILFNQGYGAVTVTESDTSANPDNVIRLGTGLTAAATTVTADGSGDLVLDFGNGDSITLTGALNSGNGTTYGVQNVVFADGTVWNYATLLTAADTPSATNTILFGDTGANTLDGTGIAKTLVGAGGGDTFLFNQGYGALTIDEADASAAPDNVLRLGAGLSAAAMTVTGDSNGDLILSFGGGDTITLAGALLGANGIAYGVQQLEFADGTNLAYADLLALAETPSGSQTTLYGDSSANTLDGKGIATTLVGNGGGDTFVFKQGYGALSINEADTSGAPSNVLQIGQGLSAANLKVTGDAAGDLVLNFGGGDVVTLVDALTSTGTTTYGVQQVDFADGTTLTYAQLLALADTPTSTNTTLYGDTGANTLDGKGIATTLVGNGGGDTFVFNQGYGALTIAESDSANAGSNVLQLGTGLSSANAIVTADASGDLLINFGGGDVVTIQGALTSGASTTNGVQQVNFADGTSWTYAQMLALADTGTANNTALFGDGQGDTFNPNGFAHVITSTGGGDTINYAAGGGALTINETDTSGAANNTLVLGAGILESGTSVSTDAGNDIILSFGNGDSVTLTSAMTRSDTTAYGVQNIQFADGTVWSLADLRYQLNPSQAGLALVGADPVQTVNLDTLDGGGWINGYIDFTDTDTNDFHSASAVSVSASGDTDPSLTNAQLLALLETTVGSEASGSDAGSINWSFSGSGLFDYLQPNQSVTLNYVVAIADGQGGELRQNVSVTVTGSQSNGSQLTLYGSGVTINYQPGRGDLYINDVAGIVDPNNTLAFAAGIDPSMVSVHAVTDPQATSGSLLDSLQLVVAGSGTITLADALSDPTAGVQTVKFADGTVWTYAQLVSMLGLQHPQGYPYNGNAIAVGGTSADVLDSQGVAHVAQGNGGGDTFIYNRGYGALDIIEIDPNAKTNTLAFGAGIASGDVTVTMTGVDHFKLSLGNGDFVTFEGSGGGVSNTSYYDQSAGFSVPVGNAYTGIEQVTFADGTTWSIAQLIEQQTPASPGILYGTEGSGTFDPKGVAHTIDSEGTSDQIDYNLGYGALTINENSSASNPDNTIVFGVGISASMLNVTTDGSNLYISVNATDTITINNALGNGPGNTSTYGIQTFTFADGTSLTYADVLALANTPSAVRRQNIWHRSRRKLAEGRPRLGLGFRRRAYGVASADVRWSVA